MDGSGQEDLVPSRQTESIPTKEEKEEKEGAQGRNDTSFYAGGTLSLSESDKEMLLFRSTEALIEKENEVPPQENLNQSCDHEQKASVGLIMIRENPSMKVLEQKPNIDSGEGDEIEAILGAGTEAGSACTPLLVYDSFPSWKQQNHNRSSAYFQAVGSEELALPEPTPETEELEPRVMT